MSYTNSLIFLSKRPTKLSQILGVSHLLFNSKRHQCRGMFCVSLLASHLDAYTWKKSQTIRRLGLPSHFDCYKIGVHWRIFDLSLLVHMKTEIMVLKYHNKWLMFSVSLWFVAGWGRNDRIWRWKIVFWTRRQSGAGGSSDFVDE